MDRERERYSRRAGCAGPRRRRGRERSGGDGDRAWFAPGGVPLARSFKIRSTNCSCASRGSSKGAAGREDRGRCGETGGTEKRWVENLAKNRLRALRMRFPTGKKIPRCSSCCNRDPPRGRPVAEFRVHRPFSRGRPFPAGRAGCPRQAESGRSALPRPMACSPPPASPAGAGGGAVGPPPFPVRAWSFRLGAGAVVDILVSPAPG